MMDRNKLDIRIYQNKKLDKIKGYDNYRTLQAIVFFIENKFNDCNFYVKGAKFSINIMSDKEFREKTNSDSSGYHYAIDNVLFININIISFDIYQIDFFNNLFILT